MDLNVYIAGTQYRVTSRYSIREQVGQPASSSLEVKLEDKPFPKTHSKVEIKEDGVNIFVGFVHEVETPVYSSTFETDIIPIQVISQETIFTRRLVNDVWKEKLTHEIVQDLYDNYLAEEGYTLGIIEEFERLYNLYTVPNLPLSDVLTELGDELGAVAQLTPLGVFNFVSKNSFNEMPAPTHITGLKLSEHGQDLKTIQKVSGAKAETSIITKGTTWEANQTSFLLGYQVAEEPNVSINASPVEVGIQGIDDDNATKTFLWKYGNNALVLNSNATVQPITGDNVSVLFRGFYNIEVVTENEQLKQEIAGISGTSGKIESVVVDTSITTPQDGENVANNLLQEKSQREQSITLITHDIVNSQLLNAWVINKPELNINGSFVIVERTITDFYDQYKINLKLKNRGFYSRYGTVFNRNKKEINNLTIRKDDLVLKSASAGETVGWEETLQSDQLFMQFSAGTTDIFSPLFFEGITPSGGFI